MSDPPNAYDTQWSPYVVVVGVDFSDVSHHAIREALRAAQVQESSEVHAVHVVEGEPQRIRRGTRIEKLDALLEDVPDRLRDFVAGVQVPSALVDGDVPVGVHVRVGRPVAELLQFCIDVGADLLVVGSHGRTGMERWILGSVSERLVRQAHCPVLVARPIDYAEMPRSEAVELEPPCAACMAHRRETGGQEWWCEEHSSQRQSHYYSATHVLRDLRHNSNIIPTGIPMGRR
jgi:nucleotide-binding universal stress UspA family protein